MASQSAAASTAAIDRCPQVGDTVHLVEGRLRNGAFSEMTYWTTPARVVRVVEHGDPRSPLDLDLGREVVHRECLPVSPATYHRDAMRLGRWAPLDEAGEPDPWATPVLPEVGGAVALYLASEQGILPVIGRVVGRSGPCLDIAAVETDVLRNVTYADQPRSRSWRRDAIEESEA